MFLHNFISRISIQNKIRSTTVGIVHADDAVVQDGPVVTQVPLECLNFEKMLAKRNFEK